MTERVGYSREAYEWGKEWEKDEQEDLDHEQDSDDDHVEGHYAESAEVDYESGYAEGDAGNYLTTLGRLRYKARQGPWVPPDTKTFNAPVFVEAKPTVSP